MQKLKSHFYDKWMVLLRLKTKHNTLDIANVGPRGYKQVSADKIRHGQIVVASFVTQYKSMAENCNPRGYWETGTKDDVSI